MQANPRHVKTLFFYLKKKKKKENVGMGGNSLERERKKERARGSVQSVLQAGAKRWERGFMRHGGGCRGTCKGGLLPL